MFFALTSNLLKADFGKSFLIIFYLKDYVFKIISLKYFDIIDF